MSAIIELGAIITLWTSLTLLALFALSVIGYLAYMFVLHLWSN